MLMQLIDVLVSFISKKNLNPYQGTSNKYVCMKKIDIFNHFQAKWALIIWINRNLFVVSSSDLHVLTMTDSLDVKNP